MFAASVTLLDGWSWVVSRLLCGLGHREWNEGAGQGKQLHSRMQMTTTVFAKTIVSTLSD